jgi:hypothetical protein
VVHCECGFEARADDEDNLVDEVRRHAQDAHGMALSHHEALLLAFRAGLDQGAPITIPRQKTSQMDEEEK